MNIDEEQRDRLLNYLDYKMRHMVRGGRLVATQEDFDEVERILSQLESDHKNKNTNQN